MTYPYWDKIQSMLVVLLLFMFRFAYNFLKLNTVFVRLLFSVFFFFFFLGGGGGGGGVAFNRHIP